MARGELALRRTLRVGELGVRLTQLLRVDLIVETLTCMCFACHNLHKLVMLDADMRANPFVVTTQPSSIPPSRWRTRKMQATIGRLLLVLVSSCVHGA